MKIDKYIGQIQFQAISVSPESSPEEIRTSCRNFILKIEGPASGETIVLQDANYLHRLDGSGAEFFSGDRSAAAPDFFPHLLYRQMISQRVPQTKVFSTTGETFTRESRSRRIVCSRSRSSRLLNA